ncbi:GIY-YIG nuclease family protein [bacterium]|nr:GIY-YIG nuclease family protein [bacterium]
MTVQTDLTGPFELTANTVNMLVAPSIGVYVLGTAVNETTLNCNYVGRYDVDVNRRLHEWIRVGKYPAFIYKHCDSVAQAYAEECRLYHKLTGLDNEIHPASPDFSRLTCSICGHRSR